MTTIYLFDHKGLVSGPALLPTTPGLGIQLPSNAIQLAEPLTAPTPGFAWCFAGGELIELPDHRGTVYRTHDGSGVQFDELGALPADMTMLQPQSQDDSWSGTKWVFDPKARQKRIATLAASLHANATEVINSACEASITGGFWSAALGEPYLYSSRMDDQLNLTGVILAGQNSVYACRNEQGVKAFRLHSFKQIRQVGDDFTAFKLQLLQKGNELKKMLDQALLDLDLVVLESVTWESMQ
jgi:hypothetical protein